MSENTRKRSTNPFSQYKKAKVEADNPALMYLLLFVTVGGMAVVFLFIDRP